MPPHRRAPQKNRPVWHDLAGRFMDDRECLASFIALECAEIIEGDKPANLLSLVNRPQRCGRNLYSLWKRYGERLLDGSGLTVLPLQDRGSSILLLVYKPAALDTLLTRKNVTAVLRKCGYPVPLNRHEVLTELESRLHDSEDFPHEIGVFLGYPLKDVVGFLGWVPLPFVCQGPWKIYGDPRSSMRLVEQFRNCRCRMAHKLAISVTAVDQLCAHGNTVQKRDLFTPTN